MARRYEVTVHPDYQFPTARSAGRKFSKGELQIVHEGEAGWEEIVQCPILRATELPPRPALPEVDASNEARSLAAEAGIDLATIEGTGKEGRILKADVQSAIAEAAKIGPQEDEKLEQPELPEE